MRCVDLKRAMVWLFAILLSGLVLSCTNELDEMYGDSLLLSEEMESTSPYHIPLNNALDNLEKTMDVMGMTATRAQYNRARWTVERIPMSHFRPDTRATDEGVSDAIYVVNFDNNSGYAIVSADTRLPDDVIAVTNSGMVEFEPNPMDDPLDTLTLEDLYVAADDDYLLGVVENDGLIENLVTNYIIGWTDSLRDDEDEFGNPLMPPGGLIIPGEGGGDDDSGGTSGVTVSYDTIVSPGTAKLQTKWHQRYPYNRYCPNRYYHRVLGMRFGSIREYDFDPRAEWGDKYLDSMDLTAGCVSIAVGQILAYHKYPEVSVIVGEDNAMSWDSLLICHLDNSKDARYEDYIAKLVHSIGVGCNMAYGFWEDQSFATPMAAKRYLEDIGYDELNVGWYDFEKVKTMLDNDCPVFIGAVRLIGGIGGHAWVIDGYKTKTVKKTVRRNGMLLSETVVESTDYVHCNWGWENGSNNGWFANKLLEENDIDVRDAEEFDSTNNRQNFHYDFWFRMIEYDNPSEQ